MKLKDLKGKKIIRTAGNEKGDRSYMTSPILVEKIVNNVVYYRYGPDSSISILSAGFLDDKWIEVDEIYTKEHWPEKPTSQS